MNAWTDCLTDADDGMTADPVQPGEVRTLQLLGCREFRDRCPEIGKALLDSAAFVNWRRIELGEPADPGALLLRLERATHPHEKQPRGLLSTGRGAYG